MPFQTDLLKGPFSIVDIAIGAATGDANKAAYSSIMTAGWIGYCYKSKSALTYYDLTGNPFGNDTKLKDTKQDPLWWAIAYITLLAFLTGKSNDGKKYKDAAASWRTANIFLNNAVVDTRDWSGSTAADKYDARNAEQMARVSDLEDLDKQAAAVIASELDELEATHLQYNYEIAILLALVITTGVLELYNPAAARAIQLAAAYAGAAAATGKFSHMAILSTIEFGPSLTRKTVKYEEIASDAAAMLEQLQKNPINIEVPAAPKSFTSEFVGPTGVAPLGTAPGTATASGGPDEQVAPLLASTTSTGDGGRSADASPAAVPEDEAPETEPTPGYPVPTMSQVASRASQASAQAAQFSDNASVTVGLVSDTVGVVDQINSMAQSAAPAQGTAAPVPAGEAAATEEAPTAEDGAAAGAEGAERAPIDVAAGGAEQPQPIPVERVL